MLKPMNYLIVLGLLFATPAWAAEHASEKETHIHLSATSNLTLANDEVVINYRMESVGRNANALRNKVNAMAQRIQQQLQAEKHMKLTTLSRRMDIIWRYDKQNNKQVRDGWRLVQVEQLVSTKLNAVPEWVDTIEKAGAHLNNLSFRISDAAMQAAQTSLRLQAIKAFRSQAKSMAKAFEATSFRIVQLQTTQQQPVYARRQTMMSKSADSGPNFHAGESKVSVTVSGSIALPFVSYSIDKGRH